jgi:hypothetical protein
VSLDSNSNVIRPQDSLQQHPGSSWQHHQLSNSLQQPSVSSWQHQDNRWLQPRNSWRKQHGTTWQQQPQKLPGHTAVRNSIATSRSPKLLTLLHSHLDIFIAIEEYFSIP